MLAEYSIRPPLAPEVPANLFQAWKGLQILLESCLARAHEIQDSVMMARVKKPSGHNKKERRRQQGVVLPSEVNHQNNAGVAEGLIFRHKGGVSYRRPRKPKESRP